MPPAHRERHAGTDVVDKDVPRLANDTDRAPLSVQHVGAESRRGTIYPTRDQQRRAPNVGLERHENQRSRRGRDTPACRGQGHVQRQAGRVDFNRVPPEGREVRHHTVATPVEPGSAGGWQPCARSPRRMDESHRIPDSLGPRDAMTVENESS
jgi:hypothetical protein